MNTSDIKIRRIGAELAKSFIYEHHYSNTFPRLTKLYLGAFVEDKLVGAFTLGWGTQPKGTIKHIFKKHELSSEDYLEIGRMCFLPSHNNSNYGSAIMSRLVRWLSRNTDIKFLYTMADGIMGKCGYVYQASNFAYIGSFHTSVYMDKATKEKIHPRSCRSLNEENAAYEGKKKVFWLTHNFCEYKGISKIDGLMFRYVYPLTKPARKILAQYDAYKQLSNPKDADLVFRERVAKGKFEQIDKPAFNMEVLVHNAQKHRVKDAQELLF